MKTKYDKMRMTELQQVYITKARELNVIIDANPLPGARRVDETNVPRGKDRLVMAIEQIDVRLFFNDMAERYDGREAILVCGGTN